MSYSCNWGARACRTSPIFDAPPHHLCAGHIARDRRLKLERHNVRLCNWWEKDSAVLRFINKCIHTCQNDTGSDQDPAADWFAVVHSVPVQSHHVRVLILFCGSTTDDSSLWWLFRLSPTMWRCCWINSSTHTLWQWMRWHHWNVSWVGVIVVLGFENHGWISMNPSHCDDREK